jgi:hypothetical protein
LQEPLDALGEAKMNNDTEANNSKLWLDEGFRRLYPLSAQRLEELAEQQQEDLAYRQYIETLRSLHDAADELSEKEVLALEFSPKDLQVQGGVALVDQEKDDE